MSDSGLYVHVPFCRTKCAYCGFVSQTDLSMVPLYLDALRIEGLRFQEFPGPFDSLFLGGGTPTVLSPAHFESLLRLLRTRFRFESSTEVTVEANPDDITADTPARFKDLGVTRVSLGIQALEDDALAFLGRRHSVRQAEAALDRVRSAGFESMSADLMYGLPGQTVSSWLKTLRRILSFEPDHLSCYQLTLEPHTPLKKMMAEKKIEELGEDAERELFLATSHFLEHAGYVHYEISNFARPGHHCRHNLKYWNRSPYLGLGPAAHSFDGSTRWWNTPSVRRYHRRLSGGKSPAAGKELLSEEKLVLECLFLGLRTMHGVDMEILKRVPGLEATLRNLEENGLVNVWGGRVRPTLEGYLLADGLPLVFA